jgi:very-short-patch-repair endonuclease
MAGEVADEAARRGGAVSRSQLAHVPPGRIARDLAAGRAVLALPRTLVVPGQVDLDARLRAALAWAGPTAALSHRTALRLWDLPAPVDDVVDVLVDHSSRRTADVADRVRLHRSRRAPDVVRRGGLPVVSLERAVVETWGTSAVEGRRDAAIAAVRGRRTTTARLRAEVASHPRLRGRRELTDLLGLLDAGCESELEIWGFRQVFDGPAFSRWRWQVPLRTGGTSVRLDLYDEEARLAVELDGRRFHDGPAARERDVARDARLAEQGIQTLRLTARRLTDDPAGCRRQVLRVSAARREGRLGRL